MPVKTRAGKTSAKQAAAKQRKVGKITFRRFDIAEKLESEADILAFMRAVVAEAGDDPAAITGALGHVARARNMAQLARDTGLTREGLYKAFGPGGNPSLATVLKVARALGLKLTFAAA
ncbi:addiction module antidote protein [Desertibaculum subflavum]|uniref:addiction module antidote protein n=1 Tax=Desertibaculum subflavum TaxID=2268458 RepID=UPI000E6634FC